MRTSRKAILGHRGQPLPPGPWLALLLLLAALAASLSPSAPSGEGATRTRYILCQSGPGEKGLLPRAPLAVRVSLLSDRITARLGGTDPRHRMVEYSLAEAVGIHLSPSELQALREPGDGSLLVYPSRPFRVDLPRPEQGPGAPEDPEGSTWGIEAMGATEVREELGLDGASVVVGVMDTGIDPDHPRLAQALLAARSFVAGSPDPTDDHGHGTHCSGTIAGRDLDGFRIGVASGAKLVSAKIVSRDGFADPEAILAAFDWISDPDGVPGSGDEPRVVSNSWGGAPNHRYFETAVENWLALGILPVFAAGNQGPGSGTVLSPASLPAAFAVGASAPRMLVTSFSSRGPSLHAGRALVKPEIVAPGFSVTSAAPGGGLWVLSGTSMAAPHIAGAAAVLLQCNPSLSPGELRAILEGTAYAPVLRSKTNLMGYGLVQLGPAVQLALPAP